MHKLFLTENECSIIHGAQSIIDVIGGFPSMEDGELEYIVTRKYPDRNRGWVKMIFNISGWKEVGKNYCRPGVIKEFSQDRIELVFHNVRDVTIYDPFEDIGEIKFSNTSSRRHMQQDEFPWNTPIVERPFCTFYARCGEHIIIDFDESECFIHAAFWEKPEKK